jgi:hypothetical protein
MANVLRRSLALTVAVPVLLALLGPQAGTQAAGPGDDVNRYLVEDCQFVASVKVAEFLSSGVWKEARKEVKEDLDKVTKEFKEATTLEPKDIDQVVIAYREGKGGEDKPIVLVVVRTRRVVKASDLIATEKGKTFKETKAGGQTVYVDEKDPTSAFAVIEDGKTILFGTTSEVKGVLGRREPPRLSDGMRAALKHADLNQTFVFAFDAKVLAEKSGAKKATGVDEKFLEPFVAVAGSAKAGDDLAVKLTVVCKDAETAEDGRKLVDGGLVLLKYYAKDQKDWPKEALDLIKKVKVSSEGDSVHLALTIPTPVLIKAVKSGTATDRKSP